VEEGRRARSTFRCGVPREHALPSCCCDGNCCRPPIKRGGDETTPHPHPVNINLITHPFVPVKLVHGLDEVLRKIVGTDFCVAPMLKIATLDFKSTRSVLHHALAAHSHSTEPEPAASDRQPYAFPPPHLLVRHASPNPPHPFRSILPFHVWHAILVQNPES
jgi:hypothetical protein